MIEVFPYVLYRIGGDSFDHFKDQAEDALKAKYETYERRSVDVRKEKLGLNDDLFHFIKSIDDPQSQNIIQNIRRDLYNNRRIKAAGFEDVMNVLSDDLKIRLLRLKDQEDELQNFRSDLALAYEQSYWTYKKHLTKNSINGAFKNGLVFSSKSLLLQVDAYNNSEKANKKDIKTEKSILKYLSRIYCKTSPYSTFTNLSIACLLEETDGLVDITRADGPVKSVVRLNSFILLALNALFQRYSVFSDQLPVRINPTARKMGRRFKYLMNVYNSEVFKYLDRNAAIDMIHQLLTKQDIVYNELKHKLQEATDATAEEIDDYIMKLVRHGFIEFYHGVSGIDPNWHIKMCNYLDSKTNGKSEYANLSKLLKDYECLIQEFHHHSIENKQDILESSHRRFIEYIEGLHRDKGINVDKPNSASNFFQVKPEQFFYEDTYRDVGLRLNKNRVYAIAGSINSLLSKLKFLDTKTDEQEKLKVYFLEKYGSARSVTLLKFYEDYYKDYKLYSNSLSQPENEKRSNQAGIKHARRRFEKFEKIFNENPARKQRISAYYTFLSRIKHDYIQLVSNGDVSLSEGYITNAVLGLNDDAGLDARGSSLGAFIQLCHGDRSSEPLAVVNATFTGYGKLYSRFLHLFDEKVTSALVDFNRPINAEKECYVENVDATYFNANIHPTLMPYEIWSPSSQNSLSKDRQIPITSLCIRYSAERDKLELFHKKDNKLIFVFDLCFQSETSRSKLFQLLNCFSRGPAVPIGSLLEVFRNIERERQVEREVVILPRVVYETNLILCRKRWEVPLRMFPDPHKSQSKSDFAFELNLFRRKHNIPQEVFMTINGSRWKKKTQPESKYSNDDYKPQYINFLWPQYVNLLIHNLRKKPETIVIEEMLPKSDDMLKIGGKRYVSECLLNWYVR